MGLISRTRSASSQCYIYILLYTYKNEIVTKEILTGNKTTNTIVGTMCRCSGRHVKVTLQEDLYTKRKEMWLEYGSWMARIEDTHTQYRIGNYNDIFIYTHLC